MNQVMKFICLSALLIGSQAQAVSIDWSGTYRFEYADLSSTTLSGNPVAKKAYVLNNLTLSPKIIAVDGMNIVSRFQILNNSNYPGSQAGQTWGLGNPAANSTANVTSRTQGASSIEVRQLYLTAAQEYGALVVGRAPIEFGLGMTYNAGNGAFDHWGDTHDLVGYKFLVGNLSMTPMIGKPYDQDIGQGADITDTMFQIEYNNPETESLFGLFYSERKAGDSVNDGANSLGGTRIGGWSTKSYNLILGRGWESFKFKFEAGFNDGGTGLRGTSGDEMKFNGYALALELDFPRPQSKWEWKVKTGLASGDNPNTNNFEGYALHRNYDVAFLMFNHPLGAGGYDIFRSYYQRQRATAGGAVYANDRALDEEAISNAVYFNPRVKYQFGEQWAWGNSFAYAQLQQQPLTNAGDIAKDVGFEWDTSIIYKPHDRVQWVNELGFFFPGGAYRGGSNNFDNNFVFGFQSKAAISF